MQTIRWHLASEAFTEATLYDLLRPGQSTVIKEASHRSVRRMTLDDLDVHVKSYREGRSRLVRGSKARGEYELTCEVARRGVPVPEALAWGEDERGSYLVTRTLTDTRCLLDVLAEPLSPPLRQAIARALGAFLARAHSAGVRHDDLHPGNVLMRVGKALQPDLPNVELFLIDLDAVRLSPPLAWPAARDNLLLLNRWFALRFSHSDRLRAWLSYSREAGFADVKGRARELEHATRRSLLRFVASLDDRCLGGNRHFRRVTAPGIRGYSVSAIDLAELLSDPDRVIDSAESLKRSDTSAVVGVSVRVEEVERPAILKLVSATKWSDPLASLFRHPPALHAYRMAHALRLRGLPTPRPLAVWHRQRFGLRTDGYLLLDRLPDAIPLDEYVDALSPSSQTGDGLARVSGELARLLAQMHRWNLSHRDLKAANVLISSQSWVMGQRGLCEAGADGKEHVWLVDLAGVRQWRTLSDDRRMNDLARLNLSFLRRPEVSNARRLRFLLTYLGRETQDWKRWWTGIAKRTEAKEASIRRRNRPLG